jgi:beta-lactamase regulating signal transducer with metallopeptidase domain
VRLDSTLVGLFAHAWDSTLFAAVAVAILALTRPTSPRVRHAIVTLALLKYLLPSAWLFAASLPPVRLLGYWFSTAPPRALAESGAGLAAWIVPAAPLERAVAQLPAVLLGLIVGFWALGATVVVASWARRLALLQRQLGASAPVPPEREAAALARACEKAGAAKLRVSLSLSPAAAGAMLCGVRRPRLVLPAVLAASMSDAELEAILLHELMHAQRRDNLIALGGLAACALFWMHPAVWALNRRAARERELACDAGVLAAGEGAQTYARALAKAVRFGAARQPAGLCGAGGNLRERLAAILRTGAFPATPWRDRFAAGAALAGLIVLAAAANPCLGR